MMNIQKITLFNILALQGLILNVDSLKKILLMRC